MNRLVLFVVTVVMMTMALGLLVHVAPPSTAAASAARRTSFGLDWSSWSRR